jgi:hypothetical protein
VSRWLRAALAVAALVGVALGAWAILTPTQPAALRLLGARVRIGDPSRPLAIAALCGVAILLLSRDGFARRFSMAIAAAAGALALLALARTALPTPPTGDVAVIETSIFQALDGRMLLGPYSRFLWHHPGPLYFYLLAPFYAATGYRTAGLAAAAVMINIASAALIVAIAWRRGGPRLAAALAACCALYALRFDGFFSSQWNPHALIFPTLACLAIAAAVAEGETAWLPALIAVDSLVVQTHVGLIPVVAAVTACAVAAGYAVQSAEDRRGFWWQMNASLWVGVLCWLLPLIDEVARTPGNMTRLWNFFVAAHTSGQSPSAAASAWGAAVLGAATPGFRVGWGDVAQQARSFAVVAGAMLVPIAAVVAAVIAWRRRQRYGAALNGLVAIACVVSFWSVTRIAGDILDHEVFWMSALGVFAVAAIVGVSAGSVGRRQRMHAAASQALIAASFIALYAIGYIQVRQRVAQHANPGAEEMAAQTLGEGIVDYARAQQMPKLLIVVGPGVWGVGAGVLVELSRAAVPHAVDAGSVWMFGDGLAPDGTETRTILLSGYGGHGEVADKPGVTPLAARLGFFADLVDVRDVRR